MESIRTQTDDSSPNTPISPTPPPQESKRKVSIVEATVGDGAPDIRKNNSAGLVVPGHTVSHETSRSGHSSAKNSFFSRFEGPSKEERDTWLKRHQTQLEATEDANISRKYLFSRPEVLQYWKQGTLISVTGNVHEYKGHAAVEGHKSHERGGLTNLTLQRDRVDLFIDLVWVAVIANLADTFSETAFSPEGRGIGTAVLEYIVLFLPVWLIWGLLRDFLNTFYKDDLSQRTFVVAILMLMFVYGNNAPFLLDEGRAQFNFITITYLIARMSFVIVTGIYSIFIPWLRHLMLVAWILQLPAVALWTASFWVGWPGKVWMYWGAICGEYAAAILLASPWGDRLLRHGYRKALDLEHYVKRIEGFFIIIVGSGVFLLITKSPAGKGLSTKMWDGLAGLIIFYCLNWLYFNGDTSRHYIHAVRRSWWRQSLWGL
jgi:Bacterial low temperature requirement A protein (LtrA)